MFNRKPSLTRREGVEILEEYLEKGLSKHSALIQSSREIRENYRVPWFYSYNDEGELYYPYLLEYITEREEK